jgi:hypothetical protein
LNLTPLQSRLSPWSEEPTSSRGIRHGTRSRADHRFRPSIDITPERPLPRGVATSLRTRAAGSKRVPSSWFRTTSTVSSALEIAGLLHPAADPGVRRVSRASTATNHYRSSGWIDRHVPRRRVSYPPKDSPRLQPHRVTAAVAFLPFFPSRSCDSFRSRCRARISSRSLRGSSTPRRFSACESVTSNHRCQWADALSSLGFVPLQGPSGGVSPERVAAPSRGVPMGSALPKLRRAFVRQRRGRTRPESRGYRNRVSESVPGAPHRKRWALNPTDDRSRRRVSDRALASKCSVPIRSASLP